MRKNGKPILSKIQDVMGIKNGKYCSSDVSVVSLTNNNGGGEVPAFKEAVQQQLVTYTNCPDRQLFTIDFTEVVNNGGIIPDCVLGGSVTLTNLDGYIVNYGQTICPVIRQNVKQIQGCESVDLISIDFGDNLVTNGSVYQLTFIGETPSGCYVILGESLFDSQDTVSGTPNLTKGCNDCSPPNVKSIQGCVDGKTYSVNFIDNIVSDGLVYNLSFNGGMTLGCYIILGESLSEPQDSISGLVGPLEGGCNECVPSNIKNIIHCDQQSIATINFGLHIVTDGLSYSLTFNGSTPSGCYTVQGDTLSQPTDSISGFPQQLRGGCSDCT